MLPPDQHPEVRRRRERHRRVVLGIVAGVALLLLLVLLLKYWLISPAVGSAQGIRSILQVAS